MNQTYKLLLLAAVVGLSLPACGNKKHPEALGQVAVTVNGQPIMAADFGVSPGLGGGDPVLRPVSSSELKDMVNLELLRQAAVESGLDQDKEIRARIAALPEDLSPRKTLASAYINKQYSAIPAPTEAEVSAYYNGNPAKFAERKHYEVQTCVIRPADGREAKIKAQLGKSKKSDAFERWLNATSIKHGCVRFTVDSDRADEELLRKLSEIPVGGNAVEDSKDQMVIDFVRAMHNDSLTPDQAKPQIMKTLMDKKETAAFASMIKQMRDKAKIEYVPPYTKDGFHPLSLKP